MTEISGRLTISTPSQMSHPTDILACMAGAHYENKGHPDCILMRGHEITSPDWTSFLAELAEIFEEVVIHQYAMVIIEPDTDADLFLQLTCRDVGVAEVSAASTLRLTCSCPAERHIMPEPWWSKMVKLGWYEPDVETFRGHEPLFGPKTNFHRTWDPRWMSVAAMFAELVVRTLVEVFGVDLPSQLRLTFGKLVDDEIGSGEG